MCNFSSQYLKFRFYKPLTFLFLVFLQFGCETPQQKLEGQWEIVEYKDHKQDMLPVLKKYYMNEKCFFQFPEPESEDGFFSSGKDLKDSLIWFQASINYDKPIIAFSSPYYYGISDWKNLLYYSQKDTTGYKKQLPFYLFEGKWRLSREGENYMELSRTGSNKIYMGLQRK